MRRRSAAPGTLATAANALHLLMLFSADTPLLGVADIARRLELSKSSVSRIASTLAKEGVLEKEELTGKYQLGPMLLELGLIAGDRNPLVRVADPAIRALRNATTLHSGLLWSDGEDTVCLTAHLAAAGTEFPVRIGERLPKQDSVAGRVLLGGSTCAAAAPVPPAAAQAGGAAGAVGYTCAPEPRWTAVTTLACPVFAPNGSAVAVVTVSGAAACFRVGERSRLAAQVAQTAADLARHLATAGYVSHAGTAPVRPAPFPLALGTQPHRSPAKPD